MLKKMYIFFLLIMSQCMLIGSERAAQIVPIPNFLKSFYMQIDPTKIHIGLDKGIGYGQQSYLYIALYNLDSQKPNVNNEHFQNLMRYYNESSFTLVKQDNNYNICINNYRVAQIDQQNMQNVSQIKFGYLIEDEQMQYYRTIHNTGLQEKINSMYLFFAYNNDVKYGDLIIQLTQYPFTRRGKGFSFSNNIINTRYDSFVQKIKQTNYNLLLKNVTQKIEQQNSQKQNTENKVKATDTCDKIEPKTEKHNHYLIYIAGSLSIIMIIILAKLFVIDKIYI